MRLWAHRCITARKRACELTTAEIRHALDGGASNLRPLHSGVGLAAVRRVSDFLWAEDVQ